jgi:hypothetical protein
MHAALAEFDRVATIVRGRTTVGLDELDTFVTKWIDPVRTELLLMELADPPAAVGVPSVTASRTVDATRISFVTTGDVNPPPIADQGRGTVYGSFSSDSSASELEVDPDRKETRRAASSSASEKAKEGEPVQVSWESEGSDSGTETEVVENRPADPATKVPPTGAEAVADDDAAAKLVGRLRDPATDLRTELTMSTAVIGAALATRDGDQRDLTERWRAAASGWGNRIHECLAELSNEEGAEHINVPECIAGLVAAVGEFAVGVQALARELGQADRPAPIRRWMVFVELVRVVSVARVFLTSGVSEAAGHHPVGAVVENASLLLDEAYAACRGWMDATPQILDDDTMAEIWKANRTALTGATPGQFLEYHLLPGPYPLLIIGTHHPELLAQCTDQLQGIQVLPERRGALGRRRPAQVVMHHVPPELAPTLYDELTDPSRSSIGLEVVLLSPVEGPDWMGVAASRLPESGALGAHLKRRAAAAVRRARGVTAPEAGKEINVVRSWSRLPDAVERFWTDPGCIAMRGCLFAFLRASQGKRRREGLANFDLLVAIESYEQKPTRALAQVLLSRFGQEGLLHVEGEPFGDDEAGPDPDLFSGAKAGALRSLRTAYRQFRESRAAA